MTYINSLKSEAEHTDVQAKDPDFINLDWRELLLYFYMESKEHYKDITETKKLQEAQKDWDYNDSTSPSPIFFYIRICGAVGQCQCLSQVLQRLLPVGASLVRQPKASRLHLRRCCYRLLLDQGSDHHYYHLASPYQHHQCQWQRWLGLRTLQQKMTWLRHRQRPPRAPLLFPHRSHWGWWHCHRQVARGAHSWGRCRAFWWTPHFTWCSGWIFLIRRRRRILHWDLLGGTALLKERWAAAVWGDLWRRPRWRHRSWWHQ
jgi:hypothetical protein